MTGTQKESSKRIGRINGQTNNLQLRFEVLYTPRSRRAL